MLERSRRTLSGLILSLGLFAACGGNGAPVNTGGGEGGSSDCADGSRERLECKDVAYDGVKVEGGAHVLNIAGVEGKAEQQALRKIDQQVERFIAAQRTACEEYNKCVLSMNEYKARSQQYSAKLMGVGDLVQTINDGSFGERKKALYSAYTTLVPVANRPEHVAFDFGMTATLPASAGGAPLMLRPAEPLPTNSKVHFLVQTNAEAYLYLLQRTGPEKKLEVLFPNPRIGTKNPLPGNSPQRIPGSTQHFRVNEKDIGMDYIYVVVSRKEIPAIQQAFEQVLEGKVTKLEESPLLARLDKMEIGTPSEGCKTRGLELEDAAPAPAANACTRTRGLVLTDDTAPGKRAKVSAAFATDPGDDVIVKAFPYNHVTEEDYAEAIKAFDAPTDEGRRSRGVIVEN